jgi:hypothetical protein
MCWAKRTGDAAGLAAFVSARRIGRLHVDFIRELHARIFRAFVNLGFDDFGWLTDEDLAWLVQKGKAAIAQAESKKHDTGASKAAKEFTGLQIATKQIEDADKGLKKVQDEVAPYIKEYDKRKAK